MSPDDVPPDPSRTVTEPHVFDPATAAAVALEWALSLREAVPALPADEAARLAAVHQAMVSVPEK